VKSIFILIFLVFFLENTAIAATGDCVFGDGGEANISINANQLTVPQDLPVGGTIFKTDYVYDSVGRHQSFYCAKDQQSASSFNYVTYMTGAITSGADIYSTNIDGVGIRVSMYSSSDYHDFPETPTPAPFSQGMTLANGEFGSGFLHIVVELIKTSNSVSAGSLTYSVPEFSDAVANNTLKLSSFVFNANLSISSCTVNTQTPTEIDLGTTSKSALSDIGSTSNKKDFSIVLDCSGSSNVNLSLSGTEEPLALNMGVLAPDSSSTAAGLGVQILYSNTPVTFNQPFSVGTSNDGQFTIPMSAQFYKTKNDLTAGTFSSLMTYTLTYM
jgi:type 1 fimbria pilin